MTALTPRQHQALTLAAAGNTNQQIGQRLAIHPTTVDRHLAAAYKTLGARDRAHAVALAIHHGQITLAALATIANQEPTP